MCGAGHVGCLEAFASGTAIANRAQEAIAAGACRARRVSPSTTRRSRRKMSPSPPSRAKQEAAAIIESAGRYLGIGLASIINAFNPQAIVLGGGLVNMGERMLGPAHRDGTRRDRSSSRSRTCASSSGSWASGWRRSGPSRWRGTRTAAGEAGWMRRSRWPADLRSALERCRYFHPSRVRGRGGVVERCSACARIPSLSARAAARPGAGGRRPALAGGGRRVLPLARAAVPAAGARHERRVPRATRWPATASRSSSGRRRRAGSPTASAAA